MVPVWLTVLVLAFGIAVAVIGVAAYLRIYRKDRLAAAANETFSNHSAGKSLKNNDNHVWKNKHNEHNIYVEKPAGSSAEKSDIQEKSEH